MKKQSTPYRCHLFICSNIRDNPSNPGCGAAGGAELKALLKKETKQRGWKGIVRVSTSGCMGLCGSGPNVLLHPQGIHFSDVQKTDIDAILQTVEDLIDPAV
ncbi:MAG: (2Fe-2S) ferredoxin domain-containing protein [Kiritimatiellaceae bacterium]|nr:(2Fe-2S) ferredoxin domain-containing protein [Kiritimatiellaceae bacterium]